MSTAIEYVLRDADYRTMREGSLDSVTRIPIGGIVDGSTIESESGQVLAVYDAKAGGFVLAVRMAVQS